MGRTDRTCTRPSHWARASWGWQGVHRQKTSFLGLRDGQGCRLWVDKWYRYLLSQNKISFTLNCCPIWWLPSLIHLNDHILFLIWSIKIWCPKLTFPWSSLFAAWHEKLNGKCYNFGRDSLSSFFTWTTLEVFAVLIVRQQNRRRIHDFTILEETDHLC